MIIKFKLFETINQGEPEKGNYVIIDTYKDNNTICIGRIFHYDGTYFYVKYTLPDGHTFNDIFLRDKIIKWAKNKKELIPFLQANKYNL